MRLVLKGAITPQELRDFVAFCLNSNPKERPTAEEVLKHPYIAGTSKRYPTKEPNQVNTTIQGVGVWWRLAPIALFWPVAHLLSLEVKRAL